MRFPNQVANILLAGSILFCLTHPGLLNAEDMPSKLSGGVGIDFSNYQSDYVSRQLSIKGDAGYQIARNDIGSEFLYTPKTIQLANASPTVLTDKYDANLKWKIFFDDSLYYAYLSPRLRHNLTGYYRYSQALRLGVGKNILADENNLKMSLEAGTGYRLAYLQNDEQIRENIFTLSEKLAWKINSTLTLALNLQHEQSDRETYRTAKIGLNNKLTEHFGVVFEYTNTRAYPFDSLNQTTEQYSSAGLAYEF